MEWTIQEVNGLDEVVEYVLKNLLTKETSGARVLGLYGNLGVGKTTFTQKLVAALGGTDAVVSPTFILERDYVLSNNLGIQTLAHIDAYRFDDEDESIVLRVPQRLQDTSLLYVIEWPEKMGKYMPEHTKMFFEHAGGDARNIKIVE
jgi:tRNA threonylcarbamoyladenosine biosynthesis protein TsaE